MSDAEQLQLRSLMGGGQRLRDSAAYHFQVWVTTHSQPLAEHIRDVSGVQPIALQLINGETIIDGDEPE